MKGFRLSFVPFAFIAVALFFAAPAPLPAQATASLQEGIALYNEEKYEKAIPALTRARAEAPDSAEAAFYLGMAYRHTNDIRNAYARFEEAAKLKPLLDNTILQLIEAATLLNKFDTAHQWIAVAEEHGIYEGRVAFLKGTALAKQSKNNEAIAAFEKSKRIDPAYAPSADLQIGICYMNQRKFALAGDHFQAAMAKDPLSETAAFAWRYKEIAEQWGQIERPIRLTIRVMTQYDTNYLKLPDPSPDATAGMKTYLENQKKESLVAQNVVLLGYSPVLPAPFTLNASYMALDTLHQRYGTDNDTVSNGFFVSPGINFDRFAVLLMAGYTHNLRRDDSYKRYSESFSVGPLFRFMPNRSHILEAGVNLVKENYAYPVSDPANEDESSSGPEASLNWIWFFQENGLFNLKLDFAREKAEGRNYDNTGCRVSAGLIYPLRDKLRLQLGGEFHLQDYKNENTLFNHIVRKDRIYTGTVGLTWSLFKQMDVIAQYLHMRAHSNIYAYDYRREIGSLGVEFRF